MRPDDNDMGLSLLFSSETYLIALVLLETSLLGGTYCTQEYSCIRGRALQLWGDTMQGSVGRSSISRWHCNWELRWARHNYWKWQLPDSQNTGFVPVASLRSLDEEKLWRLLFYGFIPRWGICSESLENGVTYGIALNHRICLHSHVEPLWYITLNVLLKACKLQRARLCTKTKAIKREICRDVKNENTQENKNLGV